LSAAFIHEKKTDVWGWSRNYIEVLRKKLDLDKSGRIPAFWLAAWLFREREWPENARTADVVEALIREFFITREEVGELFGTTEPDATQPAFTEDVYSDAELLRFLEPAPDSKPEEGGTLQFLGLDGLGPTQNLEFNPGERLSIITGDNGLGKTFLLECAWWALTGQWAEAEQQVYPRVEARRNNTAISFEIAGKRLAQKKTIKFDWDTQSWPAPPDRPTIPGLIIYARVDGSFAVWDPARHATRSDPPRTAVLRFTRDQVLRGFEGKIEGLLRDWVTWQRNPDPTIFEVFRRVLRRLSPPDMGPLTPGDPIRLPFEPREMPTLLHRFGQVPIIHESAGVRRIVTIAYLLVWAWNEHRIYSGLAKKAPQDKMVVLIDEMEAHLHPKWQRIVLPALLDVTNILAKNVQAQIIVATHSPLVLASVETSFSDATDKLFHLHLTSNGQVTFKDINFVRYGRIDEWLTSDLFELTQPRSSEGEQAIEQAKRLLADPEPAPDAIVEVTKHLRETLANDDEFWPRWLYFAEQKGVGI
jgi:predicted ATPase